MTLLDVHRPRLNLDQMLETSLLECRAAGLLQITKPRRPSAEDRRILRRERRIDEAVNAMLDQIKELEERGYDIDYAEVSSWCMSLRDGVDFSLEEQADQFLAGGRRGVHRLSDPRDWLTKEQLTLRRQKEVYNTNGMPDARLVVGIYKRAYNPHIGSRPTKAVKSEE